MKGLKWMGLLMLLASVMVITFNIEDSLAKKPVDEVPACSCTTTGECECVDCPANETISFVSQPCANGNCALPQQQFQVFDFATEPPASPGNCATGSCATGSCSTSSSDSPAVGGPVRRSVGFFREQKPLRRAIGRLFRRGR